MNYGRRKLKNFIKGYLIQEGFFHHWFPKGYPYSFEDRLFHTAQYGIVTKLSKEIKLVCLHGDYQKNYSGSEWDEENKEEADYDNIVHEYVNKVFPKVEHHPTISPACVWMMFFQDILYGPYNTEIHADHLYDFLETYGYFNTAGRLLKYMIKNQIVYWKKDGMYDLDTLVTMFLDAIEDFNPSTGEKKGRRKR